MNSTTADTSTTSAIERELWDSLHQDGVFLSTQGGYFVVTESDGSHRRFSKDRPGAAARALREYARCCDDLVTGRPEMTNPGWGRSFLSAAAQARLDAEAHDA